MAESFTDLPAIGDAHELRCCAGCGGAFLTNHYPVRYASEPPPFWCRKCAERRGRGQGQEN